jgi:hypothetical protein
MVWGDVRLHGRGSAPQHFGVFTLASTITCFMPLRRVAHLVPPMLLDSAFHAFVVCITNNYHFTFSRTLLGSGS